MKLKLSDYSNIADVVAATAIVLSLIYVGIQVSDNTQATRSATANSATAITISAYNAITSSTETSDVWFRGMTNPSALNDAEKTQYILSFHIFMLAFQNSYYLSKEGTLDAEIQESVTETLHGVSRLPGFKMYWLQRGKLFMSEFRNYVDEFSDSDLDESGVLLYRISDEKLVE